MLFLINFLPVQSKLAVIPSIHTCCKQVTIP